MTQTDKYYSCPVVCKPISCVNECIQLDTSAWHRSDRDRLIDSRGYIRGTYMKVVSFVSNNAAVYPN